MTRHLAQLLLLPCLGLAACAGPLNNESAIGNAGGRSTWAPPTISQSAFRPVPEGLEPTADQKSAPIFGTDGPVAVADAQPSVVDVNRDNWSSVPVIVPNNLPAHQPRFATNYLSNWSPRARGEFPTERTALNMGSTKGNEMQVVEAIAAPFVAASDLVLFIPRAVMETRAYRPTRTGTWPYERQPRDFQLRPTPLTPVEAEPPTPAAPSDLPPNNEPKSDRPEQKT